MKRGDLVEVNTLWAGGPLTSKSWLPGYEVRVLPDYEGNMLVAPTVGPFRGREACFHVTDVRPLTRERIEHWAWIHTHKDFRGGSTREARTILYLNPKTGGTEAWPLSALPEAFLLERAGIRKP